MTRRSPAQRRLAKVERAFDADALIRVCSQTDFSEYATRYDLPPSGRSWRGIADNRFYWYQDNGASVLAVAHLDHVQWDGTCTVVDTADGLLALSGALDDRLGAYVILELLPKLGVKVDWLLTTDEEMGASTADEFFPDHKQYNWIIEFDRGGTDVVMYQYDSPDLRALVEEAGAKVGQGSYSDIADLDHLGCVGLNWGVGYYDYHSSRSHAWLRDTFTMVAKFLRFYQLNADTSLPYERHYRAPSLSDDLHSWLSDQRCPDCNDAEVLLDRWGCCWTCGFDIADEPAVLASQGSEDRVNVVNLPLEDVLASWPDLPTD